MILKLKNPAAVSPLNPIIIGEAGTNREREY